MTFKTLWPSTLSFKIKQLHLSQVKSGSVCTWNITTKKHVNVTDGPFDIRDFVTKQCKHSDIKLPAYFEKPWVNIRKLFKDFYKQKEAKNIARMLETLDMTFDGREHSGLDDARNLHRIAQHMVADGCIFKTNMFWGPKMKAQQRRSRKV